MQVRWRNRARCRSGFVENAREAIDSRHTHPLTAEVDAHRSKQDAARKRDILPYLERLRDEARVPIIYVSHNAAEVKRIASHVVRIEDGRVVATGTAELLDAGQVDMLA